MTNITLEQAIERIAIELCARELKYRASCLEDGATPLANPEDWFSFDVVDGDMGEMILEKFTAKLHEFETRPQAVEYLVANGMRPDYAKVAIDQQYNYDDPECTNQPLRGMFEDLSLSGTQSCADLDMVRVTWEDMLSTNENGDICVDGEPMYDGNGDPF